MRKSNGFNGFRVFYGIVCFLKLDFFFFFGIGGRYINFKWNFIDVGSWLNYCDICMKFMNVVLIIVFVLLIKFYGCVRFFF